MATEQPAQVANEQQRESARKLGQEFERAVLAFYEDGGNLGQPRAFDFHGATGKKFTCVWVMAPADQAMRLRLYFA